MLFTKKQPHSHPLCPCCIGLLICKISATHSDSNASSGIKESKHIMGSSATLCQIQCLAKSATIFFITSGQETRINCQLHFNVQRGPLSWIFNGSLNCQVFMHNIVKLGSMKWLWLEFSLAQEFLFWALIDWNLVSTYKSLLKPHDYS